MSKLQTRGIIAKRSGLNAETIRYYEKIGLLDEPQRSAGGHRLYTETDYQRVCFIRRCRELDFSLEEIREFLTLVDANKISCGQVKQMAENHLLSIQNKIDDLRRMELTLRELSTNCSGDS